MYKVKYIENGMTKESVSYEQRDDAVAFQVGLLARNYKLSDGSWYIKLLGIHHV